MRKKVNLIWTVVSGVSFLGILIYIIVCACLDPNLQHPNEFFKNVVDSPIGLPGLIIGEILAFGNLGCYFLVALQKTTRKNCLKLEVLSIICAVPSLVILGFAAKKADGSMVPWGDSVVIDGLLATTLANLLRAVTSLLVYDWKPENQRKVAIPVYVTLIAIALAFAVLVWVDPGSWEQTHPWIKVGGTFVYLTAIIGGVLSLFNAYYMKQVRAINELCGFPVKIVTGDMLSLSRACLHVCIYFTFFVYFHFRATRVQRYEMLTYINGSLEAQAARKQVYKESNTELIEGKTWSIHLDKTNKKQLPWSK